MFVKVLKSLLDGSFCRKFNGRFIEPKVKAILKKYYSKIPIKKNKIVFDNFGGRGYGDNPKYIAEEIHRQGLSWDMVWLVRDMSTHIPAYVRKVRFGSARALYELTSAKMWVDNIRYAHLIPKKEGQIYLQTWHGSHPVKPIEKQAEELLSDGYIASAKYDGSITDGILVDCDMIERIYREAFWLQSDVEYLRVGLPRTDYLIQNASNANSISNIRQYVGVQDDAYIVLYAPTFRDDYSTDGFIEDFDDIFKAFSNIHENVSVLVRFHPNENANKHFYDADSRIYNVSDYPDEQELIIACDCLITDYSSLSFDFSLLNKPVFIYEKDILSFREKRGLTEAYEEWPFPKAKSLQQLSDLISKFNEKAYLHTLELYYKSDSNYNSGEAARRTVSWLCQKCGR